MSECIVVTGGGTGGHIYPVLAVLEKLASRRIVWIGSGAQLERSILAGASLRYYGIPAGKLRRYFSLKNVLDIFKILLGFVASVVILVRERPALVFSKGGYVSVAPVAAARILGIPCLTHESDLRPGLATRINARLAGRILVSFPVSARHFDDRLRARVLHTGNPVRSAIFRGDGERGRRRVGCPQGLPLVLVLGGSLGSAAINALVYQALAALSPVCYVVHQTGAGKSGAPSAQENYYAAPYFYEELPDILAASDLVVCRAGANTLWELAALGKASVLIPLPREASRGDQIENAAYFADAGAALVLEQEGLTAQALGEAVLHCIGNADKLERMAGHAADLGRPDAADRIAGLILESTAGER